MISVVKPIAVKPIFRVTFLSLFPLLLLLGGFQIAGAESDNPVSPLEWNVFLNNWRLIGPFDSIPDSNLQAFKPSLDMAGNSLYQDKSYTWQKYQGGGVNFDSFFDPETDNNSCFAFAYTLVVSDRDRDAVIAAGFDDCATIWVNGEQVFTLERTGGCTLDEFKVPIHLKQGENALLFKIVEGGGSWEMVARLLPAGVEKPFLTGECKLKKWYFIANPPILEVELLDGEDKTTQQYRCSGFRLNEGFTRFPLYISAPASPPAKARATLESDYYNTYQKTYAWEEIQDGRLPIQMAGNRILTGRVQDAEGKPVADARLSIDNDPLPFHTDADGRFQLTDMEPAFCSLAVFAEGFQSQQKAIDFAKIDSAEFKLERGGRTLKGVILDEEGKPIEGATIHVSTRDPEPWDKTDAQGRFVLSGLTVERNETFPVITHPDFIGKGSFNQNLLASDVTEITYTLEKGGSVVGRVASKEDGKPLANIQIMAGDDNYGSNVVTPSASTDSQGAYILKNLPPGNQTIHVLSDRFAPEIKTIDIKKGGQTEADFEIEPGKDVTGRIVDPEGKPILDVQVGVNSWQGKRIFHRNARTDAEGKFTLAHMPSSPVSVDIYRKQYISNRHFQMIAGEHYDLVLKPAFPFNVEVRLADTGAIPEKVSIDCGDQWNQRLRWHPDYRGHVWNQETGTYSIVLDEPIQAEKTMVRFNAPGYKAGIVEIPKDASQTVNISLRLERAPAGMKGQVVSAKTGEPMKEITIAVVNKENPLRMDHYSNNADSRMALRQFSGIQTKTDDNGRFELPFIENIDASMIVLLPPKEGFCLIKNIPSHIVDGALLLKFPPLGKICGRVTLAGKPVPSEKLMLWWKIEGNDESFGYGGEISANQDGYYEYNGLNAGSYQFGYVRSFDESGGGRMSMSMGWEELTLAEGQELTHNIDRPAGVELTGRTLITSNKPIGGCIISLDDQTGRVDAVQSDSEGNFVFQNAPKGQITLRASLRSNREFSSIQRWDDIANGQVSVSIDAPTTADILLKAKTMEVQLYLTGVDEKLEGGDAPEFERKLFDSEKSVRLSGLRGKNVVVVFWASDDDQCIEQLPVLKELYKQYQENERVAFLAVSLDTSEDDLRAAVKKYELSFPITCSSEGLFDELFALYGMKTIPSAVIINPEGKFADGRLTIQETGAALAKLLK